MLEPALQCPPAYLMSSLGAIRKLLLGKFPPLDSLTLTPTSFESAGDLVIELGRYEFSSGEASETVGKYLHVWRPQGDGTWGLYRNIANSDGRGCLSLNWEAILAFDRRAHRRGRCGRIAGLPRPPDPVQYQEHCSFGDFGIPAGLRPYSMCRSCRVGSSPRRSTAATSNTMTSHPDRAIASVQVAFAQWFYLWDSMFTLHRQGLLPRTPAGRPSAR